LLESTAEALTGGEVVSGSQFAEWVVAAQMQLEVRSMRSVHLQAARRGLPPRSAARLQIDRELDGSVEDDR
jgi:hypothetical protein